MSRVTGYTEDIEHGDYYKADSGTWYVCCGENKLIANLANHNITEHADGTISASPSILVRAAELTWHGYLENGILREI